MVSVLNVVHLPELQRTLLEQGLVELGRAQLTLVQEPSCYDIRILPRGFKREAAKSLRDHQDWLRGLGQRRGCAAEDLAFQVGQIEMVIDFMLSEDKCQHLRDFRTLTARLDALRSESTKDVLPELAPILEPGLRHRLRDLAKAVLRTGRGLVS